MFKRTSEGISNEHLFYNVNFMVYCEGKCADNSQQLDSTCDELFWSVVLRHYGLKFAIKSVGTKSDVMSMLDDVKNNNLKNTLLCVDADYDRQLGILVEHPAVIHTYGYSWETDVLLFMNFSTTLNLFITCADDKEFRFLFSQFADRLKIKLKRVCYVDIMHRRSPKALFDREKPQSIIVNDLRKEPAICVSKIIKQSLDDNFVESAEVNYDTIEGWKDFFGKTAAKLVYHWFCFTTCRERTNRKVSHDTFMGHLASSVELGANALGSYYERKINSFLAFSGAHGN